MSQLSHSTRPNDTKHFTWWYVLAVVYIAVFILPVARRAAFETPLFHSPAPMMVMEVLLIIACPVVTWLAVGNEADTPRGKLGLTFFILAATAVCEVVHYWVTDRGHYFPPTMFPDNTAWEQFMHGPIIALDYPALPHSYRFFPDSIVQFYMWMTGDFVVARIAYRLQFTALLFVGLYRYARAYATPLFSAAAVLILVAIYPITILKYAGQFVDPMANGAYVICLACLAHRYEPGFGPTLFAGLMAKESVIVAGVCRVFYGKNRWRNIRFAAFYTIIGALILVVIRSIVNRGHAHLSYKSISGVDLQHIRDNFAGYHEWALMYAATFGPLLPGAVLGWRLMDRAFQWTAAVVVVSTLLSSLLFSWMSEVRNMTPAFIVLIVVNVVFLENVFRRSAVPGGSDTDRLAP